MRLSFDNDDDPALYRPVVFLTSIGPDRRTFSFTVRLESGTDVELDSPSKLLGYLAKHFRADNNVQGLTRDVSFKVCDGWQRLSNVIPTHFRPASQEKTLPKPARTKTLRKKKDKLKVKLQMNRQNIAYLHNKSRQTHR